MRTSTRPSGGRWQPPATLAGEGVYPLLALDGDGNAIASWESPTGIPVATRPAGGAWSAPQILYSGRHRAPKIAGNARGDAIVVWDGGGVRAAVRPAGGAFGQAQVISHSNGAQNPSVAIDARGDAIVAWLDYPGSVVRAAFRLSGGRWSTPQTLSASHERSFGPSVAIDGCGGATVVWSAVTGRDEVIEAAGHTRDGHWRQQQTVVSAFNVDDEPQVGMDTRGGIVVAWSQTPQEGPARIWTRTRSDGGKWNIARPIPRGKGLSPSLTVDARGDALLGWEGQHAIEVVSRVYGGHWQRVRTLFRGRIRYGGPQVVIDARGDALVAWQDNSDLADASIETSIHPALFR